MSMFVSDGQRWVAPVLSQRYFEHAADWSHAASHVINLGDVIDKAAVCPQRGFQLARLNANPPSNSHTTRRKWLNLACFEQSVVECRRRCRRTESRRPTVPSMQLRTTKRRPAAKTVCRAMLATTQAP
jgi:hypothetical protein